MDIKNLNQNVVKRAGMRALEKAIPQLSLEQLTKLEDQIILEQAGLLAVIREEKSKRK